MDNIRQLAVELLREDVERARRMDPAEKFWAGPRLFDMACEVTMAGIRRDHPNASEEEVRRILRERLMLAERLERRVCTS
jgi:hypothetical protein